MAKAPRTTVDPDQQRYAQLLARLVAIDEAQDQLLPFARLMRPSPNDVDDVGLSLYEPALHHRAIAHALHELDAGRIKRLIINCPPRHGKTELASKLFLPWYAGRHPEQSIIFGTYNEKFSWDIGHAVRDVMLSAQYRQVFPHVDITSAVASVDKIIIPGGGQLSFVGRGGSSTGRGGHLLCIDDPIKDRKEADSPTIRNALWDWFNQVFKSRMMTDEGAMILIQTRWHSDDLVGRLTDPNNEYYDAAEARNWHIIDLPALAEDHDPLQRKEGEPLWPTRFSKRFLEDMRRGDPRGFASLYQGRPAIKGGSFFQEEWLTPYGPKDLPRNLRTYCASDHAVSTQQDRDKTCLIPVGVDEEGTIWILPDVWWRRAASDVSVEAMLAMIRKHKPLAWWAERGHITKSIGPFLRKRMLEEQTFAAIHELVPVQDKQTRAQSIQGRMAMRRVRFPVFAPWWAEARTQLLTFPAAAHDDFVDALSYIGLGLDSVTSARSPMPTDTGPKPGTLAYIKQQTKLAERATRDRRTGGF